MIAFINRLIKHNRDDEGDFGIRVLLHIPVGVVMSIPVLGWGLIALFIFYEKNEDRGVRDEAWKDVFGAMAGFIIGLVMQASMVVIVITKVL